MSQIYWQILIARVCRPCNSERLRYDNSSISFGSFPLDLDALRDNARHIGHREVTACCGNCNLMLVRALQEVALFVLPRI